jgi:uncharacterized protein (UPF0210 family)
MKIRTITTGISFKSSAEFDKIKPIAGFNQKARVFFEREGYEVQTTRIATNSWEEYLPVSSPEETLNGVEKIEEICRGLDVGFFNIGYAGHPENIRLCSRIVKKTSVISCSGKIGDSETGVDYEKTRASAEVIKRISEETENGEGNFRFCAWANCRPGIPFFPAGYHEGENSFSIGLESSDLVMRAFLNSENLLEAEQKLKSIVEEELKKIQDIAQQASIEFKVRFKGIDASLAPSLKEDESIAFAYEKLLPGRFGDSGTLAISSVITGVLKNLSVKTCGYSGLMLPVCEDFGLARRASERTFNLTDLLLYSAVCGCGLDVVPLPGDISAEKLESILLDMAALAIKLDKPLSARLLPVPGKKAGEMTAFNSPYLVDCRILDVE